MPPRSSRRPKTPFRAVYFLVLLLFGAAALAPELRLWGFGGWAFLPPILTLALLAAGVAAGLGANRLYALVVKQPVPADESPGADRKFLLIAAIVTIITTATFWLFRGQTHFLGDGYQLLSRLTGGSMMIKQWDIGASFLMDSVYDLLGGPPSDRALAAYRIVSIVSGSLFMITVCLAARALFIRNLHRYLFFFGLGTGGYMLLYFGYVENYATFIFALVLFCLTGLLAARGRISKWWVVLPFVAACGLHIFGALFLPSLIYLLARDTAIGRSVGKMSARARLLSGIGLVLAGSVIYYYLYTHYYFFTFALLPLLPDRFTVEGDYLVSLKHLADTVNLLVLLVPGLPLFIALAGSAQNRPILRTPESQFLIIAVLCSLIGVYVFNPGIGMPRNWDLFAVVGVPIAVLCYSLALGDGVRGREPVMAALLAIVLGVLSLTTRVVGQAVPEIGIATFKNYMTLDKIRNRNARSLLVSYYRETGDSARANVEQAAVEADFPESLLNKRAKSLIAQRQFREAERLLRQSIEINPLYVDGYGNLGVCLLEQGKVDSAQLLFELADGINPYNVNTINNIGTAMLRRKEYVEAEGMFHRALAIDSTLVSSMAGLASVYVGLDQLDSSIAYVDRLAHVDGVPSDYFKQAGDAFVARSAYPQAARAFTYALERGLDSSYVRVLQTKHPQLIFR
ncbi:MAG: tetratricopeptide repeat protein [Candidatus Zixiibacteriota bacterium]